jgi:molybdenum cofactor biosynthesis enzyme
VVAQGHVASTVEEAENIYVNQLKKGDVVVKAQVSGRRGGGPPVSVLNLISG